MLKIEKKLKKLPKEPGVYFLKNRQKNILYIGKAKNLKNRVKSYFQKSSELSPWKKIMVSQIVDLETIFVKSDADALVLENELIKKYRPRFNVLMKDDKSYLYIEITNELYPRVLLVRHPDFRKGSKFYGPYPSAKNIKIILRLLHRIFPYRTGRNKIIDFFEGGTEKIYAQIEKKMKKAAKQEQFEKAALYRDQLQAIDSLKEIIKTPEEYLRSYYQKKAISPNLGLKELGKPLKIKRLKRIEIFDISNFQGKFAAGSMVVFTNGLPDKKEYRKFKIKTVFQSNDVAMIKEIILRRLKHKEWPKPDLIILDGGLPQLSSVAFFVKERNIKICALAKREEELYLPNKKSPLKLKPDSQGYFLLQRMRDETHRFAIAYYRRLHRKSFRPQLPGH